MQQEEGKYAKKNLSTPDQEFLKEGGWFGKYGKEKRMHGQTEVLGLCIPNELGLHDMSGNIWEWCWDWRGAYPEGPLMDPKGPNSGSGRVLRGGSWFRDADHCRVALRYATASPITASATSAFVSPGRSFEGRGIWSFPECLEPALAFAFYPFYLLKRGEILRGEERAEH